MSFYWMGHFVGQSAYFVVARGVPPFVAGALLFRLDLPSDPMRWVWFVLSIGGAALVASRWWFLVSLISFWVVGDVRGWLQMSTTLMIFCSGSLIPLQFLPAGIEAIVRRTPFAAMLQLPGEVLLGRWNGAVLLAVQIGWLILLHVIGALTFSIAARRLVIDGG